MILKSYIRIFTNDIENTLRLLKALDATEVDLRFRMEQMGIEIVALGHFCIVAGSDEALAPIRSTLGPIVVDDLAATEQILLGLGAIITIERSKGHTGVFLYAKHPDGSIVEYVEWDEQTRQKMLKSQSVQGADRLQQQDSRQLQVGGRRVKTEHQPLACKLIKASEQFKGKQGLDYAVGISEQSAGSQAIHMQLLSIPPGGRALAHKHQNHETAIYALQGDSHVWHGDQLEHHSIVKAGDFFYIPADVPHLPYNPSLTEAVTAVIARTDPDEQESVQLLPELEGIHPAEKAD